MTTEDKNTAFEGAATKPQGGQQQPTHVLVPAEIFGQVRAIMGQLPHDQVAGIVTALNACQGVSNPVFRPPGMNGNGQD